MSLTASAVRDIPWKYGSSQSLRPSQRLSRPESRHARLLTAPSASTTIRIPVGNAVKDALDTAVARLGQFLNEHGVDYLEAVRSTDHGDDQQGRVTRVLQRPR